MNQSNVGLHASKTLSLEGNDLNRIVTQMRVIWKLYQESPAIDLLRELSDFLPAFLSDPDEYTALMTTLVSECFRHTGDFGQDACETFKFEVLAQAHFDLVRKLRPSESFEKQLRAKIKPRPAGGPPRVVLTAPQMLGIKHSPTAVMFDFAEALKRACGASVILLNSSSYPATPSKVLRGGFVANVNPQFAGVQQLEYRGSMIPMFTPKTRGVTEPKILECLAAAMSFQPDFVLSLGSYHVFADLMADYVPVVCMPAVRTQPVSGAHVHIDFANYWDELELPKRGLLKARPIVKNLSDKIPAPPPTKVVRREDLGFDKDDFVFVAVGVRLAAEIHPEFEALVHDLLTKNSRARLLLVGLEQVTWTHPGMEALKSRVSYVAYEPDLNALFRACDCMLNPMREGAGFTTVIAMDASLPVLTPKNCGVSGVIGDHNAFATWSEIEAEACRMVSDAAYHSTWRSRMKTALEADAGIENSVKRVVEFAEEAKGLFEAHGSLIA